MVSLTVLIYFVLLAMMISTVTSQLFGSPFYGSSYSVPAYGQDVGNGDGVSGLFTMCGSFNCGRG